MNRRSFLNEVSGGVLGRASAPLPASALVRVGNNENPYGPGPAAIDALTWALSRAHRYPGTLTSELSAIVARVHDVPVDHVLLSGGSGDVMRAAVYTFTNPSRALVTPRPTYEAPMRTAQHIGSPVVRVPLAATFGLDVAAIAASSTGAGMVYLCNPNNPTSTAVPGADLSAMIAGILKKSPSTRIFVDEAYFDYADVPGLETMIPEALRHPQVIVTRTFSKIHGMAGMRVAYAIAQPPTLAELRPRHSGSSISAASLAAAAASLQDAAHLERMAALNRTVRDYMVESFSDAGYRVAPAHANFIFVNVRRDARAFAEACHSRGIQVGRVFPPMSTWARIAVGTREEMEVAMPVFKEVLSRQIRRSTA